MKKICYLLIILVFIFSCKKKEEAVELALPVKVAELKNETLELTYSGNAEIKPVDEVPYTSSSSGTLKIINFKNGDYLQNKDQLNDRYLKYYQGIVFPHMWNKELFQNSGKNRK